MTLEIQQFVTSGEIPHLHHAVAAGAGGPGALVLGSDGTSPPAPPTGPVPDRNEGVEPPAAQERPARRPWEEDRERADEIDLDAVLARRRAVND